MDDWMAELEQRSPEAAWDLFLERHRRLIFAGIRHYAQDYDDVMDVFAQVCEALRALADVRAWVEGGRRSPAPLSRILLGTTRLSPGRAMVLALDLPAGDYRLTCLVPDARDGRPHLAHGMEGVIPVR